jgi:hypothetical protein
VITRMNNEEISVYNSFLKRIDSTLKETVSIFENSMLNRTEETLENNIKIWKQIQNDLGKSGLPREAIIRLSLHCDDVFRKYAKKVDEMLNP